MDALEDLRATLDQAEFEVRRIQARLNERARTADVLYDQIDWSHVGDAKRLLSQLREINIWLYNEEE